MRTERTLTTLFGTLAAAILFFVFFVLAIEVEGQLSRTAEVKPEDWAVMEAMRTNGPALALPDWKPGDVFVVDKNGMLVKATNGIALTFSNTNRVQEVELINVVHADNPKRNWLPAIAALGGLAITVFFFAVRAWRRNNFRKDSIRTLGW